MLLVVGILFATFRGPLEQGMLHLLGSSGASIASTTHFTFIALQIIFGLAFLFLLVGFLISYLEYRTYRFTLEEFDLKVERGILTKHEISISYRQIQDVNIERSLFYQLFGISKLVIMSAGREDPGLHDEAQAEVILDPLDKNMAEEIREELQGRIGVQVVEPESKRREGQFS